LIKCPPPPKINKDEIKVIQTVFSNKGFSCNLDRNDFTEVVRMEAKIIRIKERIILLVNKVYTKRIVTEVFVCFLRLNSKTIELNEGNNR
jgi:hypothetical protein